MKKIFIYVFTGLFVICLVGGCRGGRYDLTKSQLKTNFQGSGKLAIGVQDQRQIILDGSKPPSYIGIHRDGYGIPKDAGTRSGKSLAVDIAAILASALYESGFKVNQFLLSPKDDLESALSQLAPSAYDKIVVLTFDKFRSDSWAEVELQWAIKMKIYDGKGNLLAEKDSAGTEEGLKRNYTGAISNGQAQKAISERLRTILAELMNGPDCRQALLR